ncbi:unnamed protein product, partial [Ranitomeya imitator]
MDYRARERTWLTQLDQVFGSGESDAQQMVDHSWDNKFGDIKSSLFKRSRLWRNKLFLEKYNANNMIPRGLRVRVIPTFPVEDQQFIEKWEEACNACSKTFLQLLINQNAASIETLDKSIDELHKEIRTGCPSNLIEQFEVDLNKQLDQLVKKIQDNQIIKFNRDKKDYQNKRIIVIKRHFYNDEFERLFPTEEEQEAVRILEELALEHENKGGKIPPCIRPRSQKFPPFTSCPSIDLFVRVVTEDLRKIPKFGGGGNLTGEERVRLRALQNLPDVVLKPANKGGNVVVWPISMYEDEAFRQLNNVVNYKKLTYNPLSAYALKLEIILKRAIDHDVVSKNLASALQDTGDLLRRVDGLCFEGDTLLTSVDVESLYTNIRHSDGLRAVSYFLGMSNLSTPLRDLILELLEFTLTHNFFVFKGSFYLQLQGTAMGAAFAPAYANLFLGLWERDLFLSDEQGSMERVLLWTRYIDDIFFVWQGTAIDLAQFVSSLNDNDRNIRLTPVWDSERIDFLDVTIHKDESGLLQTDIFRKLTATNTLLHASSCHPRHVVRAVPVGQFLRLRRICSTDVDFEARAEELKSRFLARGYSRRSVRRAYFRAKHSLRNNLLYNSTSRQPKDGNKVRFMTSYSPQHVKVRTALSNAWPILKVDPIIGKFLPDSPAISFRRAKNLRDYLTQSHYVSTPASTFLDSMRPGGGCAPCGRCVACPNVEKCTSFVDSEGSSNINISCLSRYVIYYATCPCGLIYIGLTTRQLKVRIREHVLGILAAATCTDTSTLKTIPRHFREFHQCNASGLKVRGIDLLKINIRGGSLSKRLAQIETRWIWTLQTISPKGLNENISFAPY